MVSVVAQRQALGVFGEQVAAAHLTRVGCRVIARRWRCRAGEIDLVAEQWQTLVFVEVRCRRGHAFGAPEESLTLARQARLLRVAQHYLYETQCGERPWRVDLIGVEVTRDGRIDRLVHLVGAIEGPL